jgi:hypothetical protein
MMQHFRRKSTESSRLDRTRRNAVNVQQKAAPIVLFKEACVLLMAQREKNVATKGVLNMSSWLECAVHMDPQGSSVEFMVVPKFLFKEPGVFVTVRK